MNEDYIWIESYKRKKKGGKRKDKDVQGHFRKRRR